MDFYSEINDDLQRDRIFVGIYAFSKFMHVGEVVRYFVKYCVYFDKQLKYF